jgi:hypothetical protein
MSTYIKTYLIVFTSNVLLLGGGTNAATPHSIYIYHIQVHVEPAQLEVRI